MECGRRTIPLANDQFCKGGGLKADISIDWSRYAKAYDYMCAINPYYQENLDLFQEWFRELNLEAGSLVVEVGAGTGNFICRALQVGPDLQYIHWDLDSVMNEVARKKYEVIGASVQIVEEDVEKLDQALDRCDVMLAINCVYSFDNPSKFLDDAYECIHPGGYLFCIDLGRPLGIGSWSKHLFWRCVKDYGFLQALVIVYKLKDVILQNRNIDRAQEAGKINEHSLDSFSRQFEASGFTVEKSGVCYWGKCDLVIARKPIGISVEFGDPGAQPTLTSEAVLV